MRGSGLETVVAWDLKEVGNKLSMSYARLYTHFLLSTTGPCIAEETEAKTLVSG